MNHNDDTELWDTLAKIPGRKTPAGFADAVMARIASEPQAAVKSLRGAWIPWSAAAAALIGAAALVFEMVAPVSVHDDSLLVSIDDEVLLDSAYESLGYELLQDAVCSVSSADMDHMGEADLTKTIF